MNLARHMAHGLVHHAARGLPWARTAWAEPMRQEVDSIEDDLAALRWAAGCLVATYSERITTMRLASLSPVIGLVALLVFVFGGYWIIGGHIDVIVEALPHELTIIVLAALAATSILTSVGGPGIWQAVTLALRGRRFQNADYRDLAFVLINASNASAPVAFRDTAAVRLIDDGTAMLEQQIAPDQIGSLLHARIAGILAGHRRAVQVLRNFGRSLLWFGGVAFLLGAVHTLGFFTEPLEVIGGMFGASAVGLVVGLMAAIGIVQPLANRLDAAIADDGNFYEFIRTVFLSRSAGSDVALAVHMACNGLPEDLALNQNERDTLASVSVTRA